jgi:hypothetical protein
MSEGGAFLTTTPGTQVQVTFSPQTARLFARRKLCDVYWGSHGCARKRGHRGKHRCGRRCPPFSPAYAFGDDWHE